MESLATVFGRRLKLLRRAKGLTQEQLGKKADIDYKHIGAIERGDKTPSFEAVERISSALQVGYYELFLLDRKTPQESMDFEMMLRDVNKHGTPALKRFLVQMLAVAKDLDARQQKE